MKTHLFKKLNKYALQVASKATIPAIIFVIGLMLFYVGSKYIGNSTFISPSQIIGFSDPSTLKIKTRQSDLYISSYLIRSARGDEGCSLAVEMANTGYAITNKLLKDAKTIRLEFMPNRTRSIKTAKIFIDEKRLGTTLYKNKAAIKYDENTTICTTKNKTTS
jgi:hypothetical protein